jgi:hypothetical protein
MAGSTRGYRELFDSGIDDARTFWADAAPAVTWTRPPQRILDDSNPPFYRWFPDAELNTCANALDRHVSTGWSEATPDINGRPGRAGGAQLRLPVTRTKRTYTHNAEEAPRQSLPAIMCCRAPKLSTMPSLSMHRKNDVVGPRDEGILSAMTGRGHPS